MRQEILNQLSWQDLKEIVNLADLMLDEQRFFDQNYPTEESYYQELLTRLNHHKRILRNSSGFIREDCISEMEEHIPIKLWYGYEFLTINSKQELEEALFSSDKPAFTLYSF